MSSRDPHSMTIGRLYEPLSQLAVRIHRGLTRRARTLCSDGSGYVFVLEARKRPALPECTVIGSYTSGTDLDVIETDLRAALRERASSWIIDWNRRSSKLGKGAWLRQSTH